MKTISLTLTKREIGILKDIIEESIINLEDEYEENRDEIETLEAILLNIK